MKISEQEARVVLNAVNTAQFERGETPEEVDLVARIRSEFPVIDWEIKEQAFRDNLWAVEAEKDPATVRARGRLSRARSIRGRHAAIDHLAAVKAKAFGRLLEAAGRDLPLPS